MDLLAQSCSLRDRLLNGLFDLDLHLLRLQALTGALMIR